MVSREKVVDLIRKGKTAEEVMGVVGCSHGTVYNIAKEYGLEFKHNEKGLREIDEKIILLRKSGKTYPEIAVAVGMQRKSVKVRCKVLGIDYTEEEMLRAKKRSQKMQTKDEESVRRDLDAKHKGVVYVGGYTNNASEVQVRCLECGYEFETYVSYFYNSNVSKIGCPDCKRRMAEQKAYEARLEEERKQEAKRQRLAQIEGIQIDLAICEVCGNVFIPKTERMKYCCMECRKKSENTRCNKKDKRLRRLSKAVVDKDITLRRVAMRDHDVCWLCGKKVDWSDIDDERVYAGNNYPSIDHVVPLAKGGKHSWDNVRLAHRICNSYKSDREVLEDIV